MSRSAISEKLLTVTFILLGLTGVLNLSNFNYLPVKPIFLFLIALLFFITVKKKQSKFYFEFVIILIYLSHSIYMALEKNINFSDFSTAYMVFFYLLLIPYFINSNLFGVKFIKTFFSILLIFFLLKYSLSIILGTMHRPGVFLENNFELIFLTIVFLAYFELNGKIENYKLITLLSIFLLSGSRSGMAMLIFAIIIIFWKKSYFKSKYIPLYFLSIVGVYLLYQNLYNRLADYESIDRYNFLNHFLYEIRNWNLFQYLFGNPTLTSLSYSSCRDLSYYDTLFSRSGECYSVVFHSYHLRMIFDHGIIGLFFTFYFVIKTILFSKIHYNYLIAIIGIFLLNGFSVSSLNSQIGILGLIIYLGLDRTLINQGQYADR